MAGHDLERLSGLIDQIYEASLEPHRWPAVVNGVTGALEGSSAQLWTPLNGPETGGFNITMNIPETMLQQYVSRYHQFDLWRQELTVRGMLTSGTVATDEELVPRRTLLASPYYKEFLAPANASRLCFVTIFGPESEFLRMTALSIYRAVKAKPFAAETKRWMKLLTPHLSRALGVMYRLQNAEFQLAVSHTALDRLNAGVVLLGSSGEVVFANRMASAIIDAGNGVMLERAADGSTRLSARSPGATARIRAAVAVALDRATLRVEHFAAGIPVERSGLAPVMLSISALPADNPLGTGIRRPHAIVFMVDTEVGLPVDARLLKTLYGLTPAESRLTIALCSGDTLNDVADKTGVSLGTLRSQLKTVFSKTSTTRQHDLVRLVLSLSSSRV